MTRPVVGLTAYAREVGGPDGGRIEGVDDRYTSALADAGAVPVVLPVLAPEAAAVVVGRLDALVLTGGGDVHPAAYGQPEGSELVEVDAARDAFECALVAAAHEAGIPTLGVCRGMQVLNVAFGGTLHQSLVHVGAPGHEHPIEHLAHEVSVVPGSRIAALTGTRIVAVNSRHHQAIDRCAPGWVVTATADDGVVEAVEPADGTWWAAGIQWHPEAIAATPAAGALFGELVRQARHASSRGAQPEEVA